MQYEQHNYASSEQEYKNFLKPAINEVMVDLSLQDGAKVLDTGCGPGSAFPYLAALNDSSSLVGLDASVTHLAAAKEHAKKFDLSDRVRLVEHDLFKRLPFENSTFDLIWISDVLFPDDTGKATFEILSELKRVLKPHGQLVIFYGNWLRFTLLPGFSRLENSIHVANELSKSDPQEWSSDLHPENCSNWLQELQFSKINFSAKSVFYKAPLEPRIKQYIHWHLEHIYKKAVAYENEPFRFPHDQKILFEKITDPNHSSYILNDPNYWCSVAPVAVTAIKPA